MNQKRQRLKSIKSIKFSYKFLEEIRSGKWLNDIHIKTVCDLLIHQFPMIPGLYDPKYGEDLSFPSTSDGFVQILHYENHWVTIHGITCELVKVYDSLNSTMPLSLQAQIASIAHCQTHSITLEVHDTQLQKGNDDCALFAIAYATDLCYGNDPAGLRYFQEKLRQHLIECLKLKKILPFPSRPQRHTKPVINTLEVFCTCRLPENDEDMVACDVCNEWYHISCEEIPLMVLTSGEDRWFCSRCTITVQ